MNKFFARRFVVQGLIIAAALILLTRLFYIQVIDRSYFLSGQNNVLRKIIIYPARGPILDRNHKILVQNEIVYDIMVVPHDVKPLDTLEFCRLVGIDKAGFDKRMKKAINYSPNLPSPFEKLISARDFAPLQERLSDFPGFYKQSRTVRISPDSVAAQFLGYTQEANQQIIDKSGGYYGPGDLVGVTGVEKSYETVLRGRRGIENTLVDARGNTKGVLANKKYDTLAVAGERLISSLDIRIQKLGEQLMKNKVGSIVAIEPSTGEILAYVSSPTYDPNEMSGSARSKNYGRLRADVYKPLLNRPIQGRYSPGSSFKPLDGLIALQDGLITPATLFYCPHYYQAGNRRVLCEHFDGPTNLEHGIAMSCNTYFCNVFDKLMNKNGAKNTRAAFNEWRDKVMKFGLGGKLDIDLPNEYGYKLPTAEHYDKVYGKGHWRSNTIISLAIGQGELDVTPLQMANTECIMANRGYFYTPHLIKAIGEKDVVKPEFKVRRAVGIDEKNFNPIIDGMQQVVESGTAANARIPGIVMCGKTGTVQNSHGANHSVFVAFAPRDHPKIAIAVIVENGGYGAAYAAPIASYLVEKYLTDSISRPMDELNYIMNKNLLPAIKGAPPQSGTPAFKRDSLKKDSIRRLAERVNIAATRLPQSTTRPPIKHPNL